MQFILRITLLGIFATAGVALAISVAEQTREPSKLVANDVTAGDSESEPASGPLSSDGSAKQLQPIALPQATMGNVQTQSPVQAQRQPQQLNTYPVMTPVVSQVPQYFEPVTAPPLIVTEYKPPIADPLSMALDVAKKVQAGQNNTADAIADIQSQIPGRDNELPAPQEAVDTTPPKNDAKVTISEDLDVVDIDATDSDIRYVLKILSKAGGLNILASPSVNGSVSASLQGVPVDMALTALLKSSGFVYVREGDIIYVGTPEDLQNMEHVAEATSSRIYRPDYVSATELQNLITPMLTENVGQITVSSPSEVGIESNANQAGGDTFSGADVVMVRDYVTVLAEIDQIVAQVDQMPIQVAIESTILSVRLDDRDVLGVDFELLRQKDTLRITSGTPLSSLATADFRDGLKIGFLDSNLFAFIEALETIGDTTVVASPRVMCLNKQRAEILIGSELGYVSTTVTETAATQAVEFLEVGTHLRIRPFVSSDGMVRMEVHPELSTGTVRVQEGFTLPDKDVTQVTTNIMCRTGSTIVIGGLIREDLTASSTQIPVLGNLPFVGGAFRQRTEDIERREIIVLLTPRVIDEPQAWHEGEVYAKQFDARLETFRDKMSPLGKRQFGERYVRLARAAYAAGDLDTALRNANLAIHFDPLNQAAINLRTEIIEMAPELEVGVHRNLKRGLPIHEHPHHDYSRQGYPWRPIVDEEVEPLHLHVSDSDEELIEPVATDE